MKRLMDLVISGTVLLLLSPVLVVVILILKLTGEREAFYFQDRVGFMGKIIPVTKFVTMVKNSPNIGTRDITLRNDPRVLPVGKFLRKSKLNEVPQLWDVFVGKLSLVGWRPLMPKGFADYPQWVQEKIVHVKPGLTGIGSLVFRDEEAIIARAQKDGRDLRQCYREDIMPFKGELESWYVDHPGILTDFKILVATAIAVLFPRWRGFWNWFPGIPKPQSPILQDVLGVTP
ncbi:UDP-glucose:undecaprenyl-phosphate glucose-1-phosphate transferase [Pirellula sp. SH-Sr6A]|uniref:sugar transferase n=1 Tax=Pirellula sp. SH-Sr6A TaxID=1632865 RepID=UPI00078B4A85|nr:sugar transferase [Pirellula sp. SH-Sr6A]AMV31857.1 UDP-glucose:undecaprenyl-phosphate glucose-1-phosphate transferase [Pirellula sp. SH-Sr6A]